MALVVKKTISHAEAVKQAANAEKKGYGVKLGADYLVVFTPKGRIEVEVEPEKKVSKK